MEADSSTDLIVVDLRQRHRLFDQPIIHIAVPVRRRDEDGLRVARVSGHTAHGQEEVLQLRPLLRMVVVGGGRWETVGVYHTVYYIGPTRCTITIPGLK